jgi:hypothetical protein
MISISVRQPWAELILEGKKTVEIRKSSTSYRGILVIHAANIINKSEFKKANIDPKSFKFERKSLIGVVELVDVIKLTDSLWEELRAKHLVPGKWLFEDQKYAWILENPRRIKPIDYTGLPRFFEIDEKAANKILKELESIPVAHKNV